MDAWAAPSLAMCLEPLTAFRKPVRRRQRERVLMNNLIHNFHNPQQAAPNKLIQYTIPENQSRKFWSFVCQRQLKKNELGVLLYPDLTQNATSLATTLTSEASAFWQQQTMKWTKWTKRTKQATTIRQYSWPEGLRGLEAGHSLLRAIVRSMPDPRYQWSGTVAQLIIQVQWLLVTQSSEEIRLCMPPPSSRRINIIKTKAVIPESQDRRQDKQLLVSLPSSVLSFVGFLRIGSGVSNLSTLSKKQSSAEWVGRCKQQAKSQVDQSVSLSKSVSLRGEGEGAALAFLAHL